MPPKLRSPSGFLRLFCAYFLQTNSRVPQEGQGTIKKRFFTVVIRTFSVYLVVLVFFVLPTDKKYKKATFWRRPAAHSAEREYGRITQQIIKFKGVGQEVSVIQDEELSTNQVSCALQGRKT